MDDLLNALQWPAMAVTLVAAWLIASLSKRKRSVGFWCFMASNALWIAWGLHDHAWALIGLQLGLFATNVRGAMKNDPENADTASDAKSDAKVDAKDEAKGDNSSDGTADDKAAGATA